MLFVQEGSDTEIFSIEVDVYSCDVEGVIADKDLFSNQGALGFENGGMEGECSVFFNLPFDFEHEEKLTIVIEWEESDIASA